MKTTTTPVSVLEKRKIADELENFFHEIKPKETKEFKDSEDANQFILCASVDYGIIAENAWQFYDLLKQRLGYFTINKVASMPKEQLERLIGKNPMIGQKALHRFPIK